MSARYVTIVIGQQLYFSSFSSVLGGYYIYVGAATGSRSILVSPPVSAFPGDVRCFRFWYHMGGQNRQLSVAVYQFDNVLTDDVWKQSADAPAAGAWKQANIDLAVNGPFQVFQRVKFLYLWHRMML